MNERAAVEMGNSLIQDETVQGVETKTTGQVQLCEPVYSLGLLEPWGGVLNGTWSPSGITESPPPAPPEAMDSRGRITRTRGPGEDSGGI